MPKYSLHFSGAKNIKIFKQNACFCKNEKRNIKLFTEGVVFHDDETED
jgi:hypothetical protein